MKYKTTCTDCSTPFPYTPIFVAGRESFKPAVCGPCTAEREKRLLEVATEAREARLTADWERICPPLYRSTDLKHPNIDQRIVAWLDAWTPEPGRGVGLYGATGKGKTRLMWHLLKRLHFDGLTVVGITSTELAELLYAAYQDGPQGDGARSRLRAARHCDALFLDDLGKEKFTASREAALFDLLEHRTAYLKPTFWTANATGAQLEAMIGEDRGPVIVRRLREFTDTKHVR